MDTHEADHEDTTAASSATAGSDKENVQDQGVRCECCGGVARGSSEKKVGDKTVPFWKGCMSRYILICDHMGVSRGYWWACRVITWVYLEGTCARVG